ncbi:peptidoglycan-binding protein [Kitasatospora sp. NPDC085879]|uniref:peptidoglycan-binding protein n=1 Tax=Kitasatospora sp. NPDC085879 TaxID=3154769 RepID=UPI0034406D39
MFTRRRSLVVFSAFGSVLLTASGVGAAMLIKSPAQAAAETHAPAPDVLTARVERQVLTSTVVTRGRVTAGQSVDVAPVAGGGARAAVVTRLPVAAGGQVSAGVPVLEVAGRPVFPLQGELPVYRDLKPGATGQDVAQLQGALRLLGLEVGGDPAGTFGEGTKAAVTTLYRARGYDPLPSSPDGATQVAAAEEAVTAGQRALDDAEEALATAKAQQAQPRPSGGSASDGAGPQRDGVAAARKQVSRAIEDLTKLRSRAAGVKAASGPMVPADEIVYLPGFPARVDSVTGKVGSVVSGKVLTLSAGALVVTGRLTAADRGLVRPGQRVEILSEVTGLKASATVAAVADTADVPQAGGGTQPQGQGQAEQALGGPAGYRLTVQPDAPLDPRLAGQDVRLTIVAASSAGPVLVVPVSAISAAADGRTVVTVYENGQRRRVEVTPGTVGGGSAEVRPIIDGAVKEGDHVIVGVKDAPPPPGAVTR